MRKKWVMILVAVVAVAAVAAAGTYFYGGSDFKLFKSSTEDKVYVENVGDLMGSGIGGQNRYSGVVQTQKTVSVNPDSDKKVKEIFVSVGDTVEVGTPLFSYDMQEQEMNLAQLKLDLEEINDNITTYNKDLAELIATRDKAPEEDKFQYVTDIQEKQADIKQAQYDKQSKELEIANAQKGMEVTEVTSTTSGVVKSVTNPDDDDEDNDNNYNSDGTETAMITIMQLGNYRVKGTVNEQNYSSLIVGEAVIIRSRADETLTWTGKIASIDTENSKEGSDEDDYSSNENSSSSYPFYVELDSTDGLIIGQHVLIEPNEGQMEKKDGLWIYESYIAYDEIEEEIEEESDSEEEATPSAYVWIADKNDKLKKSYVELGEYDAALGEYQILSGLTEDDYIAFPMASFYEGITAVTNADEVDYSADIYNSDDMLDEGDYSDEEYLEDNSFDEEGVSVDFEAEEMPAEGEEVSE